jgi:hypothetical protein
VERRRLHHDYTLNEKKSVGVKARLKDALKLIESGMQLDEVMSRRKKNLAPAG